MSPSTETSVADDQLADFIDRILRMKEETDAIAADIREIYAEAKANGFDKTQLGNVVTYLRKKDKDAAKLEEGEAVFDLYLGSYLATKDRAPRVRAYARASNGPEITEPQEAQAPAQAVPDDAPVVTVPVESIAAEISTPITEPQPAPQVEQGSDVAAEPVASRTTQPETATSFAGAEAHGVDAKASDSNAVSTVPLTIDGNANTGGHDEVPAHPVPVVFPGRRQSEPASEVAHNGDEHQRTGRVETNEAPAGRVADESPASIVYPAPGVVVMETCPPEGALAHPYAACWPVRDIDVSEGVREPIVKIGKLILDGRGRMFAARGWDGGKGREYPVVQYDGTDPLMDCIRWNLASRPGIHPHNLKLIAGKLCKLEPTRADEIMQAFGLEVVEAAQ